MVATIGTKTLKARSGHLHTQFKIQLTSTGRALTPPLTRKNLVVCFGARPLPHAVPHRFFGAIPLPTSPQMLVASADLSQVVMVLVVVFFAMIVHR